MEEPITLCRYKEQAEIEENITWLGELVVAENILERNRERAAIYTILKGMYTVFCHKNGLFNKLEG